MDMAFASSAIEGRFRPTEHPEVAGENRSAT